MKKSQKTECGRSMVEMLGVLAISGLLGITGLYGYSTAMDRHRANELLNQATKHAVMLSEKALLGRQGDIPLSSDLNKSVSGGTFNSTAKIDKGKIKLTLSGISEKVCQQMKNLLGNNGIMAFSESCENIGELTLVFNEDLSRPVDLTGAESGGIGPSCPTGQVWDEKDKQCKIVCPDAITLCFSNQVCCPDIMESYLEGYVCDTEQNCPRTQELCESTYKYGEKGKWHNVCDVGVDENYCVWGTSSPCKF